MNRIRTIVLALTATALMGAGAFAQVDRAPATEPGGPVVTPAQTPNETPSLAQTPSPNNPLTPAQTTTTAPRDDGFDWGWIGLVGLIGLAGLRRTEERHVERDTAYPAKRADGSTAPMGGVR